MQKIPAATVGLASRSHQLFLCRRMPPSSGHPTTEAALTLLPAGPRPVPCQSDYVRGKHLRLFVYALPWAYSGQIVEYVESQAKKFLSVKCAYLREDTCPNSGFSHLENLRSHCTDVPLMYKLLQVATIVDDAERADIFLVPFLMGCNAMLGWGHGMQRINARAHHAFFDGFPKWTREHLPHYQRYPHRHLFLFPLDSMFSPLWLRGAMISHTGAGYVSGARDVPVPYLVSLPAAAVYAPPEPRTNFVFLMASNSRNPVRSEVARQLRAASATPGATHGRGKVELYETNVERPMTLDAKQTMQSMRQTMFCIAPTGDSDGFTQRFYYIIAAGCIPVRVDTYYSAFAFSRVAWPFKQTIQWRKAVVLVPPKVLRSVGLLPVLLNISDAQANRMQEYIRRVVRPRVLFDYRGKAPDAFSSFLEELLHLSQTKLPRLDRRNRTGVGAGGGGGWGLKKKKGMGKGEVDLRGFLETPERTCREGSRVVRGKDCGF